MEAPPSLRPPQLTTCLSSDVRAFARAIVAAFDAQARGSNNQYGGGQKHLRELLDALPASARRKGSGVGKSQV